jgi:hypothetical protein
MSPPTSLDSCSLLVPRASRLAIPPRRLTAFTAGPTPLKCRSVHFARSAPSGPRLIPPALAGTSTSKQAQSTAPAQPQPAPNPNPPQCRISLIGSARISV